MVKRILLSIVMLALIAYLIVAITAFNRKPADQTCRDMELVIKDTAYAGFITKDELKGILQQKGIYPIGKKMERISTKSLERELSKHPLIDQAECYKTPSGKVCVEVTPTHPYPPGDEFQRRELLSRQQRNCDAAGGKMRRPPGNCHRKRRKVVCNEGFI